MEHNRKYERKREEKEIKARKERMRKAKEEYERAKEVRYTEDESWCSEILFLKFDIIKLGIGPVD